MILVFFQIALQIQWVIISNAFFSPLEDYEDVSTAWYNG